VDGDRFPGDRFPDERLTSARLFDGSSIEVLTLGTGPHLLLPVRPRPHDDDTAATMRQWGADPDAGPTVIRGLADICTVVAADYEAHRMAHPAPGTLTPDTIAADVLAIADAAGASTFALYGYSWLAMSAFQVALRTSRVTGLVMGAFPPTDGPYAGMLAVTRAGHAMAVAESLSPTADDFEIAPGDWESSRVQTSPEQTQQFVTLYEALQDFDDAAATRQLGIPRLAFAGELDNIEYGPRWGGVRIAIGDALTLHREELENAGWAVDILPGLDHTTAMHGDVVLRLLRRWLPVALA
jgi:pimeloyl-ACP methyl ester carboxylesterase